MTNTGLRVKTSGRAGDWCYSVLSPAGKVLVTRRAFPSEYAARNAGWAAADALSPVAVAERLAQSPRPDWRVTSTTTRKPIWRALFG